MSIAESVVERYRTHLGANLESNEAVETVMAGIALLIAQTVIVSNPYYDENEVRRFLALRRTFHDQFTAACAKLASDFEEGVYGADMVMSGQPLSMIARMPASQSRQALVQTVRVLRGLKRLGHSEVDPLVYRIIRQSVNIRSGDEDDDKKDKYGYDYGDDYSDLFKDVIRLSVVPTPIKTLLRKVVQLGKGTSKSITLKPHEDENPGAWFEMTEEERDKLRTAVAEANATFSSEEVLAKDPEERRAIWEQARATLKRAERAAGVHLGIIKSQREPEKPLEEVLKSEAHTEVDGATAFALDQILSRVEESARNERKRSGPPKRPRKPKEEDRWAPKPKEKEIPLTREMVKVLTLLRKAKTFETVERIIRDATDRDLLSKYMLDEIRAITQQVGKNKAIREGVPLVPLRFKPMTVEEFQSQHDTGEVEFPSDMPEEEQRELLGRVSRAISDLEGIFGKGFCGKHRKKLAFRFGGSSGFMAKAHYFTWDNKNEWQPRVTFGEDYEGVLAHELSHFFEDLIAARLDTKMDETRKEKPKYYIEGGPGDIFGRVSAEYFTESYVEGTHNKRKDALHEILPEAFDLMAAVVNTPDYARWEDKLTNSHTTYMDEAIKNLTGMSMYDLPKDHPYAKAKDAGWTDEVRYKSQLPPELVKECERVYKQKMDGDDRKLFYYQSAAEVWARMCEQYVYMKLSKAGIANPWLTWMHYEEDVYIEEARFEKEIAPIFDRLFAKLGTRNILASIIRRFITNKRAAWPFYPIDDRTDDAESCA